MADPENLSQLYVEELQDLWSANDQMKTIVLDMAEAANDRQLGDRLRRSADGIQKHSDQLKALIADAGGTPRAEHCKGMEGLVKEARRHALDADLEGPVRDVAIIAQYQRMCHYGIAGFGTARAYAAALGKEQAERTLEEALTHIHRSDDYMSELAERSKNLQAAA